MMRALHLERLDCLLLSNQCHSNIQIHHILGGAYGRSDEEGNCVPLCLNHHQLITENDLITRAKLGQALLDKRNDVIEYVRFRLGILPGNEWLKRRLFIENEVIKSFVEVCGRNDYVECWKPYYPSYGIGDYVGELEGEINYCILMNDNGYLHIQAGYITKWNHKPTGFGEPIFDIYGNIIYKGKEEKGVSIKQNWFDI